MWKIWHEEGDGSGSRELPQELTITSVVRNEWIQVRWCRGGKPGVNLKSSRNRIFAYRFDSSMPYNHWEIGDV